MNNQPFEFISEEEWSTLTEMFHNENNGLTWCELTNIFLKKKAQKLFGVREGQWVMDDKQVSIDTHEAFVFLRPIEPDPKPEYEEGCVYVYENGKYRLQLNNDRFTHAYFHNGEMHKCKDYHPVIEPEPVACNHHIDLPISRFTANEVDDFIKEFKYCHKCAEPLGADLKKGD